MPPMVMALARARTPEVIERKLTPELSRRSCSGRGVLFLGPTFRFPSRIRDKRRRRVGWRKSGAENRPAHESPPRPRQRSKAITGFVGGSSGAHDLYP